MTTNEGVIVSDSTGAVFAAPEKQPPLRRVIGPKLLLFFVIGDILGTGIYALTGRVAGEVGGAAWLSFGLSFVVAMFTATSYVELVGKYPRAAGAALYTQQAFGIHFLTFMVAFAVMCSGLTSAGAASRAFGGDYLQEFVQIPTLVVAIAFLIVLALINFRGVSESVKLNVLLTSVELTGLLIIIFVGAFALLRGMGDAGKALEFKPGDSPFGLVVSGAALAFFALVGFEDSVNMAEETKEPSRTFPRALFLGITITGVVYMLVAFFATALVPIHVLGESDGPLLEVIRVGATWFPLWLFSLIALFAVSNSALINLMMASRLVYGMSREHIIPGVLGKVHPRRRTPWVAIVFTTALAVGLASWGGVADLGGTTALLLLCVFALVNAAVLVLRRDKVEHEHFRAPTIAPVLGIVSCAYLASPWSGRDPRQYAIAGVLLAIGLLLWGANWLGQRLALRGKPQP
ncbi:MAG TPA: APC family permease [Actinopolymorphaceae bacterium]